MQSLLESVQTTKLQAAFDKYLPAVLNTGADKATKLNCQGTYCRSNW